MNNIKEVPGYGPLIQPVGRDRPWWLTAEEMVVRHLPMGVSERKARDVATWDHPYRLRSDHSHYVAPIADVWADTAFANDARSMQLIHELRSAEADSITILCDNPEGDPNNAVICSSYWTDYKDQRYSGNSLLDALQTADKARLHPRSRR